MVQYYVGEAMASTSAAAALAACFAARRRAARDWWLAVGQVRRPQCHLVGDGVSWICLFLLSYPQTDFTVNTVNGAKTFHIGLNVYTFTALMAVLGVSRHSARPACQVHQRRLSENIGTISGIVGLAGGLAASCCRSCCALMDITAFAPAPSC